MASASSNVTLAGKVRKTKISRDGTAVVVKKTIGDATLEERFPKRRMRGKRKANDQLIPVEDVVRGMEAYAETIEPEVQRRADGVNRLANELLDAELSRVRKKSEARAKYLTGKLVAQKKATSARTAGAARRSAESFRDAVTRRMNADIGF